MITSSIITHFHEAKIKSLRTCREQMVVAEAEDNTSRPKTKFRPRGQLVLEDLTSLCFTSEWDTDVCRRRRAAGSRDRHDDTLSSRRRHHDGTSDQGNTGTNVVDMTGSSLALCGLTGRPQSTAEDNTSRTTFTQNRPIYFRFNRVVIRHNVDSYRLQWSTIEKCLLIWEMVLSDWR